MADSECPICFTNPPTNPCRTQCSHVFCEECFTRALPVDAPGNCPLCRARVSLYTTSCITSGACLRVPDVTTIIGCNYLQTGQEGVASYHFESDDETGALSFLRRSCGSVRSDQAGTSFTGGGEGGKGGETHGSGGEEEAV